MNDKFGPKSETRRFNEKKRRGWNECQLASALNGILYKWLAPHKARRIKRLHEKVQLESILIRLVSMIRIYRIRDKTCCPKRLLD